jgi:putative ABC transport system substrate-binding protein
VDAAASLGLTLLPAATASRPSELPTAFATLEELRPQALFVLLDLLLYVHRRLIIEFATRRHFHSLFNLPEDVEDGGLMAFTVEWRKLYEGAPTFVDKIMKGASPAEIPIEQPLGVGLSTSRR